MKRPPLHHVAVAACAWLSAAPAVVAQDRLPAHGDRTQPASSALPSVDDLRRSGWAPAALPRPVPWRLELPTIDRLEAARVLSHAYEEFPRPALVREPDVIPLAMPAESRFLTQRDDRITWNVRALAFDLGAGWTALDLDVGEPKQRRDPWERMWGSGAASLDDRRSRERLALRLQRQKRTTQLSIRQDPRSTAPQRPRDVSSLVDPDVPARLIVEPVPELTADVFAVTPDAGQTWFSIRPVDPQSYELNEECLFGLADGPVTRLMVVPRPRGPRMAGEVFEMDPATGGLTSLGVPGPDDASWSRVVTDLRNTGGVLQAVVLVHDLPTKRGEASESWGSVMQWTVDDGVWTELRRFALPGSDRRFDVEFTGDGLQLAVEGNNLATMALSLPATSAP